MKRIKFLLTGEGPTDYGWKDGLTRCWKSGPVPHFARKCAEQMDCQAEFEFADIQDVKNVRLQGRSMKGLSGRAVPARKFYRYMKEHQYAYGIFYCDADRESGRSNNEKEAVKRFEAVYGEVDLGANSDREKREIIPMVALRMIESWLLADIQAFESIYGKEAVRRAKVSLPEKPELLWGDKHDPESDYPKNYFERTCGQLGRFRRIPVDRDLYAELAEHADVDKLREKCPVSFGRFSKDIADFLGEIK